MKLSCLIDISADQGAKPGKFRFPQKIGLAGW
jgi:hypothetical protein